MQVSVRMDSSFPHRQESGFAHAETYAPSFPRKRESRPFGTETYRIKRFLEILRPRFPPARE
ncbi:hypothetical protein E4O75_04530 [Neisseria meningitidis]|nr:hypothetical protein [Neisseria meningitidis]MBG8664395.1 hypothetical protein [Neisseria meningitidis]MBG8684645.1 hypothetical protein [Neisseria meningitidis]MBG8712222.1 hypothetical protein [Neisseria meningitidis]MBG8716607.1 hypothetical protein [Neisseria meningitidis]